MIMVLVLRVINLGIIYYASWQLTDVLLQFFYPLIVFIISFFVTHNGKDPSHMQHNNFEILTTIFL